ncbi:urease accessory protein UreD [Georgenia sp. SUBG003]|uniref:urease accessory protein UreD n=1 Tax=Georgenia sp. SUBG003 TaxID=1497974 RepID=UPI003AB711E3
MTALAVERAAGRARCTVVPGALSPRVLGGDGAGARVGLVATRALLLGGDHVSIDVRVGAGAWLEIVETAGTVAFDAGGTPSSWSVTVTLEAGARLEWEALPFVVADGADVTRSTRVMLDDGARALLRETVVLGRTGGARRPGAQPHPRHRRGERAPRRGRRPAPGLPDRPRDRACAASGCDGAGAVVGLVALRRARVLPVLAGAAGSSVGCAAAGVPSGDVAACPSEAAAAR